jgi:hypothetical protein
MDASSLRHTPPPMPLGAEAVADKGPAVLGTNNIGRRVSLRRVVAAIWRALVEASACETEEGVVIARGWCFPWLCFPITPPSPSEGRRRTWNRGGSS